MGWTMGLEPRSVRASTPNALLVKNRKTDREHNINNRSRSTTAAGITTGRREMGWTMGLEPTTTGITTRGSTN